ncbi:hypothetical protein BDZ97DRAFT_1921357 [Flammula alnicola]|nr:hypothetical protein BDZ97DRAFT_1921357 [Flammula alnicola]
MDVSLPESSSDDDERHARDADIINLNKADDRTIETYENETGPGPTPPYAPDWANIKGPWNYALFKHSPPGLPINFYDEEWYKRFNEREKKALMIRAKAPFDLLEFHSMGQ